MVPWVKYCLLLGSLSVHSVWAVGDEDADGVPDYKDACPGTPAGSFVGANGCIVPLPITPPVCMLTLDMQPYPADCEQAEIPTIYFEFGSALVPFDDSSLLAQLVEHIKDKQVSVLLRGHTDIIGRDDLNKELSLARAENVAAVLNQDFGIARERIMLESCGNSEPVASNDTELGRAQNRRVDILIIVE
ncbi:OmpA family protein [Shewanella sp.]|uniref:OmpA family protein n=1 Tax=Shewanella sp. TaxID=50422 RepID=UPI003569521D